VWEAIVYDAETNLSVGTRMYYSEGVPPSTCDCVEGWEGFDCRNRVVPVPAAKSKIWIYVAAAGGTVATLLIVGAIIHETCVRHKNKNKVPVTYSMGESETQRLVPDKPPTTQVEIS